MTTRLDILESKRDAAREALLVAAGGKAAEITRPLERLEAATAAVAVESAKTYGEDGPTPLELMIKQQADGEDPAAANGKDAGR